MSGAQRDSGEISVAADAARPRESATSSHGSRIVVRCAGRTAVGQVRDHNEDNLVVANLGSGTIRPRDHVFEDNVDDRGLIFAVCDGMGGAAAGEVASQMAVDILVEAMRRGGSPKNRDALARRLVGAVEEAGRRIFDAAQKERSRRGMGTTATVAVLVDKVMFLAEVGDSRAYLLRRGQLKQLTKDQSLVNQLIEAGHLTEDEAEAFEHSNIILQALGTSETVQVDLTFVELRRGDRLMLCSDGLSGLVHTEAMRTTLEQLKDSGRVLLEADRVRRDGGWSRQHHRRGGRFRRRGTRRARRERHVRLRAVSAAARRQRVERFRRRGHDQRRPRGAPQLAGGAHEPPARPTRDRRRRRRVAAPAVGRGRR